MADTHPVYIGIDPTAGRRPLNYAVLDDRLRILAQGEGSLEAVLEAVQGYAAAVVAVDAPQSPNSGLLAQPEVRQHFGLRPYATTWSQFKVCEYLLRRHGIGMRWLSLLYQAVNQRECRPNPIGTNGIGQGKNRMHLDWLTDLTYLCQADFPFVSTVGAELLEFTFERP